MIKITGTITAFITSFFLFISADSMLESINDKFAGMPYPPVLALLEWVTPIGIMNLIFPVGIAIAYWVLSSCPKQNYSIVIWHCLTIIFSVLVAGSILMLSSHHICLDGPRVVYTGKIIGNIIMGLLILLVIRNDFEAALNL